MSDDIQLRASAWHLRTDSLDSIEAVLATPDQAQPRLVSTTSVSEVIALLATHGLDSKAAEGVVTIVGQTESVYWLTGAQILELLGQLAPFSLEGSYLEFDSEYGGDPSRWVLHTGKVVEVEPLLVWHLPGDRGGWSVDAGSVRAEVQEAPGVHNLDEDVAARILSLGDAAINAAVHDAVNDFHWTAYDDLRGTAIASLAARAREAL